MANISVPATNTIQVPQQSAEDIFEQQVQKRLPSEQEAVSSYGPARTIAEYQPFQMKNLPIVGGWYDRAIDAAKAALGSGEGGTFASRLADAAAQREAHERALKGAAPNTYNFMGSVPGALSMLTGVGEAGAAASVPKVDYTKIIPDVMPSLGLRDYVSSKFTNPSMVGNASTYLAKMAENAAYGGAGTVPTPGSTSAEAGKETAIGAGLGALATPIADLIGAGGKGISYLGNKAMNLFSPERAVAEDIVRGQAIQPAVNPKQRQLTLEQYLEAVKNGDKNVSLADVQGVKPQIQRAEANAPLDPNLIALNDTVNRRIAENPVIIADAVDTTAGKVIDADAERRAAYKQYRSATSPAYNAAFNSKGADAVWNPYFDTVINSKEGQAAIDFADNERIKDSILEPSPFVKNPNTGFYELRDKNSPPDLSYWDYVKRGLNTEGRKQSASPGEKDTAASTFAMTDEFTSRLRQMFPNYGKALDTAQRYLKADNAFDAGGDFFNLVTKNKGDPEEISSQMRVLTTPSKQGGFTPEEKEKFKTGLLSYVKENPDDAARAFYNMDKVTEGRLRTALGDDAFEGLDNAFSMARVRELTGQLGLTMKSNGMPMSTSQKIGMGSLVGGGITSTAGAVGLGTQAGQIAQNITDPHVLGYTMLAAALGLPVGLGTKMVVSGLASARAAAMLRMAADPSPQVQKTLQDALNRDPLNKKIFKNVSDGVTRFMLMHPQAEQPFINAANIFRIGRKSGGSVGSLTPEGLLADLKRRRVMLTNKTQHLLSLPDDAVVQALDAAKR
jgi:hypothetical protein